MPLAFPSKNHGTIAFGFFNIETDMLLLEHIFFFADLFCRAVVSLAEQSEEVNASVQMDGFQIDQPALIGNLHGAIQGVDLHGFIGETYRQFPFPSSPEGFKQKPYGEKNQPFMKGLVRKFGTNAPIQLLWDRGSASVSVDGFVFEQEVFGALIGYVHRGGYPRWQDETRPHYVQAMMARLAEIGSPLLKG